MTEIGGYIEFVSYRLPTLHESAVKMNCGRQVISVLV